MVLLSAVVWCVAGARVVLGDRHVKATMQEVLEAVKRQPKLAPEQRKVSSEFSRYEIALSKQLRAVQWQALSEAERDRWTARQKHAINTLKAVWWNPDTARHTITPADKRQTIEFCQDFITQRAMRSAVMRAALIHARQHPLSLAAPSELQSVVSAFPWPFAWHEDVALGSAFLSAEAVMLEVRNREMVERLRAYDKPNTTVVAVVGAAHLFGMQQYWYNPQLYSRSVAAALDAEPELLRRTQPLPAAVPPPKSNAAFVAGAVAVVGLPLSVWMYGRWKRRHNPRPPLSTRLWRFARNTFVVGAGAALAGSLAVSYVQNKTSAFLKAWRQIPSE
jgi:hypothetical protein